MIDINFDLQHYYKTTFQDDYKRMKYESILSSAPLSGTSAFTPETLIFGSNWDNGFISIFDFGLADENFVADLDKIEYKSSFILCLFAITMIDNFLALQHVDLYSKIASEVTYDYPRFGRIAMKFKLFAPSIILQLGEATSLLDIEWTKSKLDDWLRIFSLHLQTIQKDPIVIEPISLFKSMVNEPYFITSTQTLGKDDELNPVSYRYLVERIKEKLL